jgi:uncharacterized sulfatase
LAAFRTHCDKPVGRILYTHSHRDHISGTTVFTEGREVPILASHRFQSDLIGQDAHLIAPHKALNQRTLAQFGFGLTPEERISLGCGPGERPMQGMGAGHIPPNTLIEADQDIDLDGVQARLIHAPGETADHLAVWVPAQKVLFPGDNWYHAFPNLYAIRGTSYRDFGVWADTLQMLAQLGAEVLAPGHTRPVFGAEAVHDVLMTTRAAIRHVMQHTADGMDAGVPLDDIVASAGTLGWYDGNPTHLGTLSSQKRAQHVADLAGGVAALRHRAETTDDLQWRLELCDHLLALGEAVQRLKADTLTALADTEINATARNAYLWHAKHLREAALT